MVLDTSERFSYVVIFQYPDYMSEGTYASIVSLETNDKDEAVSIARKEIAYLVDTEEVPYTCDVDDFQLIAVVEVNWEAKEVDIFNVF